MKAVFLDRDGTLIVDPPDERVDSVAEIELLPDTLEALKLLASLPYGVVLVSNQAAIGEGRLTQLEFEAIHRQFLDLLRPSGVKILGSYVCPHKPEDNCECRKPKPLLLQRAARDLDIELEGSWMIGDRESDVLAGLRAGTRAILVESGLTKVDGSQATHRTPDLLSAIRLIAAANPI